MWDQAGVILAPYYQEIKQEAIEWNAFPQKA